jgi:signal transduction histidine kinase
VDVAPAPSLRHAATVPQRLREPAFWGIQAGIVTVTVLHIGVEAAQVAANDHSTAHHLPVILYLIPVVAACYRYGMEGGLLTGVWCSILTIPNMVLWHAETYAWLIDLALVLAVVAVGLVVATPVERERTQRRRAEAVGQRLAFLNAAAAALSDTPHLPQAIERALAHLVSTLGLRGATVVATDTRGEHPMRVVHSATAEDLHLIEALADEGEATVWGRTKAVPVTIHGHEIGHLATLGGQDHALSTEENAILSAVASQIGVAIDNTSLHRQAERRLRSYVQKVTQAQEEERHRIARDLHDDAVQQLILLIRQLEEVIENCQQPAHRQQLQTVYQRAQEILAELRRFSRDLRPATLDELGLVAALEWIANDLRDRTGIDTTVEIDGLPERLPQDIETALFRIAQETLRNVERHASATSVAVSARFAATHVEVGVVDDGVGFALLGPDEPQQATTFGLLGMRERALLIGGELDISSQPGKGTRITARVPIERILAQRPPRSLGDRKS